LTTLENRLLGNFDMGEGKIQKPISLFVVATDCLIKAI